LRTKQGLPREVLSDLGVSATKVASYLAQGLLTLSADAIAVTEKGRLLVDGIAVDLVSSVEG
jgi:coproporphyrinogen III oxidase-like Fe-S oxidoreductase